MPRSKDAFDRAVEREQVLQKRAGLFDSTVRLTKFFERVVYAAILLWACVLAANWIWLSRPRWLVVVHTIVFAVGAGWVLSMTAFITFVRRRRPDWFAD